jgi:hypothetical protein
METETKRQFPQGTDYTSPVSGSAMYGAKTLSRRHAVLVNDTRRDDPGAKSATGRVLTPMQLLDAVGQVARGTALDVAGARSTPVIAGRRVFLRRIATSCRSTTISSSFHSLDRTRRAIYSRSHGSNT